MATAIPSATITEERTRRGGGPDDFVRRRLVAEAIREFVAHYHHERNHQGLGNRLIMDEGPGPDSAGVVQRRQPLGGIAELLLSSGGLKAQADSSEATQTIRRQRMRRHAVTAMAATGCPG